VYVIINQLIQNRRFNLFVNEEWIVIAKKKREHIVFDLTRKPKKSIPFTSVNRKGKKGEKYEQSFDVRRKNVESGGERE